MVSLLVRQASKKHKKDLRSLGTSWLNLGHASLLSEDQTLLHIFVSGLVGLKQATVSSAAARLCTLSMNDVVGITRFRDRTRDTSSPFRGPH